MWRAVTDPAELAHCFASRVSGQLVPGGRLSFEFPDGDMPALEGEIVELEPPRRFAFTWGDVFERAARTIAELSAAMAQPRR